MCIHTLSVTINMQFQQKETGTYVGTLSAEPMFALTVMVHTTELKSAATDMRYFVRSNLFRS